MSESSQEAKHRFQFSLRSLLLGVATFALLLVAGLYLYDWYYSIPLADAVAEYNVRFSSNPYVKHEPPITEDEIVSSIEAKLPDLDASDQVKAIYARIVHSRRLPRGASLLSRLGIRKQMLIWGKEVIDYSIDLAIRTENGTRYRLRIREVSHPAFPAQKSQSVSL